MANFNSTTSTPTADARYDSVRFRLYPKYVEYSDRNKEGFCGISVMLRNPFNVKGVLETAPLVRIPDALPKRGPVILDPVYWIVGTPDIIRLVGDEREPQLEREAVEVMECSIIPSVSLEPLDRIWAVKRFLEGEGWRLPYWSGRELRSALDHWSRDAVAALLGVQHRYGVFVNGVSVEWSTPSNDAVAAALDQFKCRQEEPVPLTIYGVDSYPASEDPDDGWITDDWKATYTVYLD